MINVRIVRRAHDSDLSAGLSIFSINLTQRFSMLKMCSVVTLFRFG